MALDPSQLEQTESTDDSQPEAVSGESAASSSGGSPSASAWFDQMLGRIPAETSEQDGELGQADDTQSVAEGGQATTEGSVAETAAPPALTFGSEDELWERVSRDPRFSRAVQSQVDRIEERRRREAEDAELDRKLREQPVDAADEIYQRRQQERVQNAEQLRQQQLQAQAFTTAAQAFDRNILDPVMLRLPAEAISQLIPNGEGPNTMEGRQKLVTDGLNELEKHWKKQGADEQRERFRTDPRFRRTLFQELGHLIEEPDSAPGSPTGPTAQTENDHVNGEIRRFAAGLR